MEREKAIPAPSIIDGGFWDIRNLGSENRAGYVDLDKKEFAVPWDNSAVSEFIRAHETAHVKETDNTLLKGKFPAGVAMRDVQALEDCRINSMLARVTPHVYDERIIPDGEIAAVTQAPAVEQARFMLAYRHAKDGEILRAQCKPEAVAAAEKVWAEHFQPHFAAGVTAPQETTLAAAKALREALGEEEQTPGPNGQGGAGEGESQGTPQGSPTGPLTAPDGKGNPSPQEKLPDLTEAERQEAIDSGFADYLERMEKSRSKNAATLQQNGERKGLTQEQIDKNKARFEADPGPMKIETPRLDGRIRQAKSVKNRKEIPSDYGFSTRYMHRDLTDGKVFGRAGKRRANSVVLVDCSGSMRLTTEDIKKILEQCPESIVAIYSGHTLAGTLRIVAKDGRYYPPLNEGMSGSNTVDIYALDWLAAQKPKRKFWVSDGLMTGKAGFLHPKWLRYASRLLKKHKIERVGNVHDLLKSGQLIDRAFSDNHGLGMQNANRKGEGY